MRIILLLPFIFSFHLELFAQGAVAKEIGDLILAGQLDKAEERVNYYLTRNPRDVDAIMMKGNIVLNRLPAMQGDIELRGNEDESIYETDIGTITSPVRIVPRADATEIANIWKQALTIDSSREDIHFGVCQIYSLGLMADELIAYLPTLKRVITSDDRLHYSMGDYARNIKSRGDFDGAMKVYKAIRRLYPRENGLLSDIAGEYFLHGYLDSAYYYVKTLMNSSELDSMSYGNTFFISSVLGEYETALRAITLQSQQAGNRNHLLYMGLLQYLRKNPQWKATLTTFLQGAGTGSRKEIAQTLVSDGYHASYDDYLILDGFDVSDAYKILIHHAFKNLALSKLSPWFNYAELFTRNQYYTRAAVEFAGIERSGLISTRSDSESVAFYYAWTLWKLGRKEESISRWRFLLDSEQFFRKSAAAYFIGRYFLDKGEITTANGYFERVSDRANKSKYAMYCKNLLKE